jgi:chromosomal replication initiator protein
LIADIQPPDLETKVAILRRKADIDGIKLPDDVALLIASQIANIRELEGSLVRISAYASLKGREPDIELAREVFGRHAPAATATDNITVEAIRAAVAAYYGIRQSDLSAKSQERAVAVPRQVAMYLCKKLTRLSLPDIGREFGGKHHTTVLHSVNKITEASEKDPAIKEAITILVAELGAA